MKVLGGGGASGFAVDACACAGGLPHRRYSSTCTETQSKFGHESHGRRSPEPAPTKHVRPSRISTMGQRPRASIHGDKPSLFKCHQGHVASRLA